MCGLPDIATGAPGVAGLLRPGGRLFIRELHPMLATLDESDETRLTIGYPYFEQIEPLIFDDGGTYVETDVQFTATTSHEWSHGLGETVSALLHSGMELTGLVEHDSVPWQALPGQMVRDEHGEWRLRDRPERLAASFTLQARRLQERAGALPARRLQLLPVLLLLLPEFLFSLQHDSKTLQLLTGCSIFTSASAAPGAPPAAP